eukprot:675762-Pleurochrysis_carterae.AAC.2
MLRARPGLGGRAGHLVHGHGLLERLPLQRGRPRARNRLEASLLRQVLGQRILRNVTRRGRGDQHRGDLAVVAILRLWRSCGCGGCGGCAGDSMIGCALWEQ